MNARLMDTEPAPADDAASSRDAATARPVSILIAALGGEGGGVLTQWLVEAALAAGYPVQSTSIPGVAQRTGATTYYVEIFPVPASRLGDRRPVLALAPTAGCVDLLVASELLEAVRSAQNGFVDPERTMVISSTSRTLTTLEKMAMGDGRTDAATLEALLAAHSRRHIGFDMNAEAKAARTVISAVLFGAVAGSGLLPFPRAACEAAIAASGKGVDASLAGFARGFAQVQARRDAPVAGSLPAQRSDDDRAALQAMIDLGTARVKAYQDERYARLYLDRIARIEAVETRLDPSARGGHALTRETARFLALWMAFDDLIRVADEKTRPERYARIRGEVGAGPHDLVTVHDYFKPRVVEVAGALPPSLAARLVAWDARRRASGKPMLAMPVALRTDSRLGRTLLRTVAALRPLRPSSERYRSEQAAIERWLDAIERTGRVGWEPAHAMALCGRLVKGYGETHARGHDNLGRILDTLGSEAAVVAFAGDGEGLAAAIDAARDAALADPEGRALDRSIARHGAAPRPIVAKPLVFVRPKNTKASEQRTSANA